MCGSKKRMGVGCGARSAKDRLGRLDSGVGGLVGPAGEGVGRIGKDGGGICSGVGHLEFPIEFAFFLIPLGLLVGSLEQVSGSKEIKFINRKAFSTLSTATAVTLIVLVFNDYQIAEAENRKMRFASAGFVGIEDMKVEGKTYLLTQLSALHNFAETEATEDMSAKELDFMSKVATRYPYPPSLFRYALALGLNHDYQESQRILAVLQKLHDEDIYAEAVDNWGILTDKYPQLANVKPPSVDTALLDGEF